MSVTFNAFFGVMVYLHVKLVNHLLDLDDKERTSKVLQNVMLKSVHLDVMTPLVTQRPIWSVRHMHEEGNVVVPEKVSYIEPYRGSWTLWTYS